MAVCWETRASGGTSAEFDTPQGVDALLEVTNRPVRTISREVGDRSLLTPQRLHAELLVTSAARLEAYLQGSLRDGTRSVAHGTHRFGQAQIGWLETLKIALDVLGHRSWIYREGRERRFWILETSAKFLTIDFDASTLIGTNAGLDYTRGYFDADGGLPRRTESRFYVQFCQKDRRSLETVTKILEVEGIICGRIHNPSAKVDPNYWRFFVRASSWQRFLALVGSWHPIKRVQVQARMKI